MRLRRRSSPGSWSTTSQTIITAIAGLLGALIGGSAAAYSVERSAYYQARAQVDQFMEEREQQQRELRAAAYLAFYRAADSYLEGHEPASACRKLTKEQLAKVGLCSAYIDGEDASWLALHTAADDVYLYGSTETKALVESFLDAARDLDEVPRAETELNALRVRLEDAQNELRQAQGDYLDEVTGPGETGSPGLGPVARQKAQLVDEMKAEVDELVAQLEAAQRNAETSDETLQDALVQLRYHSCLELNPIPSEACVAE